MRDSCRTSGQAETPKGAKRQEAHRTPCRKRASETESNRIQILHSPYNLPLP
ncbi:hypothetical protein QUF49_12530 [Fictibacillus sp. b24]|uniref:hypothetical protein n=1 Tax=Fictibacillus sp. b24 TaxID=3055863 RepID=UPI0025A25118|nr:hypothetical protein [Fictibacillus sp. b24]MDM5316824.1 hypothetical protein [Fictibacillus sp. b24]